MMLPAWLLLHPGTTEEWYRVRPYGWSVICRDCRGCGFELTTLDCFRPLVCLRCQGRGITYQHNPGYPDVTVAPIIVVT